MTLVFLLHGWWWQDLGKLLPLAQRKSRTYPPERIVLVVFTPVFSLYAELCQLAAAFGCASARQTWECYFSWVIHSSNWSRIQKVKSNRLALKSCAVGRKWKDLPGTPRADVKCNFGLWFRLIRAAPLAELTAGWSQACDALHPQVIQVLCGGGRGNGTQGKMEGGEGNRGRRREKRREEEKTAINHTLVSPLSKGCQVMTVYLQSEE